MLKREMILVLFMGMIVLMAVIFRPNESAVRSITVTAQGNSYRIADSVNFEIELRGKDMAEYAMSNFIFGTDKAILSLESESVDRYTSSVSLYSTGNYDGLADLSNPTVRYRVNLYDLSLLDEILRDVSRLEAYSIYNLNFSYREAEMMIEEAQASALAEARTQAENLVEVNQMSIGQIVSISFNTGQVYAAGNRVNYDELLAASSSDDLAFSPIPVQVSANATVTFEMR
jgi:uncharacterized protein YggE